MLFMQQTFSTGMTHEDPDKMEFHSLLQINTMGGAGGGGKKNNKKSPTNFLIIIFF